MQKPFVLCVASVCFSDGLGVLMEICRDPWRNQVFNHPWVRIPGPVESNPKPRGTTPERIAGKQLKIWSNRNNGFASGVPSPRRSISPMLRMNSKKRSKRSNGLFFWVGTGNPMDGKKASGFIREQGGESFRFLLRESKNLWVGRVKYWRSKGQDICPESGRRFFLEGPPKGSDIPHAESPLPPTIGCGGLAVGSR